MTEISKTADLALVILEHVAEHGPAGTSDIARQLNMHRTVAHRLLATLQARGFVRRVADGYLPGTALLRIAAFVEPELLAAARPVLEALAHEHGETFLLTAPSEGDAIQVEQCVGSHHFMRVQLTRGFKHPLAKGASGRSLLAFMPQAAAERVIAAAENPASLRRQLDVVRKEGFAISRDELSPGVHGVSVPVLIKGEPVASLGVVYPALRADSATAYPKVLKKAATLVARKLTQQGSGGD